jgi:hypothetical protein
MSSGSGSGDSRESPNRANEPGPDIPLRDRGGRLEASSLLVVTEVASDSWLLLYWFTHAGIARSLATGAEVVESKLPPGDPVGPLAIFRAAACRWKRDTSGTGGTEGIDARLCWLPWASGADGLGDGVAVFEIADGLLPAPTT